MISSFLLCSCTERQVRLLCAELHLGLFYFILMFLSFSYVASISFKHIILCDCSWTHHPSAAEAHCNCSEKVNKIIMHITISIISHIISPDPMSPCENGAMNFWCKHTSHSRQKEQAPLGPASNRMHHLSSPHQQWTHGAAVCVIKNLKLWSLNVKI